MAWGRADALLRVGCSWRAAAHGCSWLLQGGRHSRPRAAPGTCPLPLSPAHTHLSQGGDLWKALRWRDQAGRRVFGWYGRGRGAALDIARGLHYLHLHHIVHFDLKVRCALLACSACPSARLPHARTHMCLAACVQQISTHAPSPPCSAPPTRPQSANVLLSRDGTCKIADVGLAKSLLTRGYLSQAGTLGTFSWR